MKTSEDKVLIESTLKGDLKSFERIVRKYNAIVFTLAFRILKNSEEAEEAAQDVFIKTYKSLDKFNFKSKFSTWIYRIAYNESINRLRSIKKYSEINELNENQKIGFYDPHTEYIKEDEKKIVLDSLLTLPETERIIITLYYYEDMPVKEIAEITGMTESNIKVRLFRCRQKLYDLLKVKLDYERNAEYEQKYR